MRIGQGKLRQVNEVGMLGSTYYLIAQSEEKPDCPSTEGDKRAPFQSLLIDGQLLEASRGRIRAATQGEGGADS